ncbi:hypothetical protein FKM82_015047 [Ascaphus truei]
MFIFREGMRWALTGSYNPHLTGRCILTHARMLSVHSVAAVCYKRCIALQVSLARKDPRSVPALVHFQQITLHD